MEGGLPEGVSLSVNLGIGLPVHLDMLAPDDPRGVIVAETDQVVELNTGYFAVKVHKNPTDAGIRTQLELDSRPAFELAMLSRDEDNVLHIILMKKKRLETAFYRREVPYIIKVPGGYDQSGGGVSIVYIHDRILAVTGISVSPEALNCFGMVIGHTEIRTPISLWCTTWGWNRVQASPPGVEILDVPFATALEMAMNALRRKPNSDWVENDTGFEGLFGLSYLIDSGEVVVKPPH